VSRALQIQQALKRRGFYTAEMTGEYDEATVEAMRRFQTQEKIRATGYPTAHALKRLGLAN
jgi:peptidoglycan hydrolase-like protein with peptidoglycan-binding domain